MREEILFQVDTPYRHAQPVKGWYFGTPGEKSLAVMGALRGNEIQQMYICARLIRALEKLEKDGLLAEDCGILVVPCANQVSMNVGRRFWAADNTDINRMFPGYDQGESTQRIAARVFDALQGYRYGVHLTSFYLAGDLLPHVRIMETGYQQGEEALAFGLPYVLLRTPQPYDTTTLNYNWQIWNTKAFSIYTDATDKIDAAGALEILEAVLRFLGKNGILNYTCHGGYQSQLLEGHSMVNVTSSAAGFFLRKAGVSARVKQGELLAQIADPCLGTVIEDIVSPVDGIVFFHAAQPIIYSHTSLFRIIPT